LRYKESGEEAIELIAVKHQHETGTKVSSLDLDSVPNWLDQVTVTLYLAFSLKALAGTNRVLLVEFGSTMLFTMTSSKVHLTVMNLS
jgi:hypothetical protein